MLDVVLQIVREFCLWRIRASGRAHRARSVFFWGRRFSSITRIQHKREVRRRLEVETA